MDQRDPELCATIAAICMRGTRNCRPGLRTSFTTNGRIKRSGLTGGRIKVMGKMLMRLDLNGLDHETRMRFGLSIVFVAFSQRWRQAAPLA